MKLTVTHGDSDTDRDIVVSTLTHLSTTQLFIRVDYYDDGSQTTESTAQGTISTFDGTTLFLQDMDDEAQHTGSETRIDVYDVTEIEVF